MDAALKKKLVASFKSFPVVRVVILYGSMASGKSRANSDIDLAVAAFHPLPKEILVQIQNDLSGEYRREVDVVDLNLIHGAIFLEAMTSGKTVLVKDKILYASLIKKLIYEQTDFIPLVRRIYKRRREKM
jgi:predicted nucleotidyltransferase